VELEKSWGFGREKGRDQRFDGHEDAFLNKTMRDILTIRDRPEATSVAIFETKFL
jgi:hypothetical protein